MLYIRSATWLLNAIDNKSPLHKIFILYNATASLWCKLISDARGCLVCVAGARKTHI